MKTNTKKISILFFVCFSLLLLSESASASSAPLMIGVKTGYSLTSDSEFENRMLIGAELQFAITDRNIFVVEASYGPSAGMSGSYPGNTTQTGDATSLYALASIMRFPKSPGTGLYYGGGLAYITFNISTVFTTSSGAMFMVNSRPSRLGIHLTAGWGGREKFFIEGRYLYTGKKQWNPFANQGTDLGGLSLNAGYRLAIK